MYLGFPPCHIPLIQHPPWYIREYTSFCVVKHVLSSSDVFISTKSKHCVVTMTLSQSNDLDGHSSDPDSYTPLLTKSLPKSASATAKVGLLLQDWWLWEIIAAVGAIIATSSVIIILVLFDGSPLPDWPSVLTVITDPMLPILLFGFNLICLQLNSVISFFAVISKLCFTTALGAAISQSKWLWYRQGEPRALQDLQIFDDASRGPWGAVTFLLSVKGRFVKDRYI